MLVSGVICEFNPFHNGHKYLLEKAGEENAYVICIMSGNFTQRGDFAVCDKYMRAETAVKNGADLVIELPLPYSVGTAETFARGSVGILDKLGFVDRLYFGSESDAEKLFSVLKKTKTEEFSEKMDALMKSGISYPDAFFEAAGEKSLSGGNDILGLEYLKQLDILNSDINPVSVRRIQNSHDSPVPCGEYASASYIRKALREGEAAEKYMPSVIPADSVSDMNKLEYAFLAALRQMSETDFSSVADVGEGLEYRLKKAVCEAQSIEDLFEKVRTKRYTLSKIRRILLCSFLGVTKDMQKRIPCFVNVLASNERGEELIRLMNKTEITPVIRYSDTRSLSSEDRALYDFTVKCDDIFGLSLPVIRETGYDMKRKFRIIR